MGIKLDLLEVVQSVLGSLDSDSVDTIGETIESEQVVLIAKETYHHMATYHKIDHFNTLLQLDGIADVNQPTVMRIPPECTDIDNVRYREYKHDGTYTLRTVKYREKLEFLNSQLCLDSSKDDIGENVMPGNIRIPYHKDQNPCYFTAFDEDTLIFDGHKEDFEATMHNDASLVMAYVIPAFELRDDFEIPLPAVMHSQYLSEVKEKAFQQLKQSDSPIEREIANKTGNRNWRMHSAHDGLDAGHERPSNARQTHGRRRHYHGYRK